MPYATCRHCGLRSYVAGGHAERPRCPRCDSPLLPSALSAGGAAPAAFRHTLALDVDAPQAARKTLEGLRRHLGPGALETAQLLVSELVTNAVKHGRVLGDDGGIGLEGFLDEEKLYVEVRDGGPGFEPHPGETGVLRSSGWGLVLVDRLADRWGVITDSGVAVWFELSRRDGRATADSAG
jgi:anti-sigma regulatory factor (Ser/Thr protein kinase)